jgi:hypothetical protein
MPPPPLTRLMEDRGLVSPGRQDGPRVERMIPGSRTPPRALDPAMTDLVVARDLGERLPGVRKAER